MSSWGSGGWDDLNELHGYACRERFSEVGTSCTGPADVYIANEWSNNNISHRVQHRLAGTVQLADITFLQVNAIAVVQLEQSKTSRAHAPFSTELWPQQRSQLPVQCPRCKSVRPPLRLVQILMHTYSRYVQTNIQTTTLLHIHYKEYNIPR